MEHEPVSQHGGKIINQGMYSCIFMPTLTCKPNTQRSVDSDKLMKRDPTVSYVSKLIHKESGEDEFIVSTQINKIPLWRNYFVISEAICEPAKKQVDKDMTTCHAIQEENISDFRLLTMPFMGTTMHTYQFDVRTFNVLAYTQHCIEAGALLNLFGIVHRDLHQGNFLIDDQQIPRIIDFNLAIPVEFRTVAGFADRLSHKYEPSITQEPPDSTLSNAVAQGYDPYKVIDAIIKRKSPIRKIISLFRIPQQTIEQELRTFYESSRSVREGNTVEWFRHYSRMIDSWAIGVAIVELIVKLSLWPEFEDIFRPHRSTLLPVLRRMCEVNPSQRIDCVQALHMIQPNHFILRKYGQSWLDKVGRI